eukprot:TRINITY_DN23552_c0_g1_i1.p1 TRINITY_DN23552_c0_g1~~TRINITY_DN23552_c0_g1_i1.p1  ORF type:complete len:475 (+),score=115.41 TRINITY_DN23552_c0_g1_i1:78-1427(+)
MAAAADPAPGLVCLYDGEEVVQNEALSESGDALLGGSVGEEHFALLTAAGKVLCLGDNKGGQLGTGGRGGLQATLMPALLPWAAQAVCCGSGFTVAVRAGGGAVGSWGQGSEVGELGREGPGSTPADIPGLPAGDPVVQVSAGGAHSVCLTGAGRVYSWGWNSRGQLALGVRGPPHLSPQLVPLLSSAGVTRIACGAIFGAAETASGDLLGWGAGGGGGLFKVDTPSPVSIAAEQAALQFPLRALAAGTHHFGAADAAGRVWLWGRLRAGGDKEAAALARLPTGGVTHLAAAKYLTVALTETGELWDVSCPTRCRSISAAFPDLPRSTTAVGGSMASAVMLLSLLGPGIMRSGGAEWGPSDLAVPLCDAGISAESEVELLRAPPEGTPPAADGPLVVYGRATSMGHVDPICLEVAADATVGELAALAARRISEGRVCGGRRASGDSAAA